MATEGAYATQTPVRDNERDGASWGCRPGIPYTADGIAQGRAPGIRAGYADISCQLKPDVSNSA